MGIIVYKVFIILYYMNSILDKVIGLFRKKKSKRNEEEFQKSYKELQYTGLEPLCMACQYPIHESQRSRRLEGKRIHSKCFKDIKKMVLEGKQ